MFLITFSTREQRLFDEIDIAPDLVFGRNILFFDSGNSKGASRWKSGSVFGILKNTIDSCLWRRFFSFLGRRSWMNL